MIPDDKYYRGHTDAEKYGTGDNLAGNRIDPDNLDSKVNTSFDPDAAGKGGSLTNDVSVDTDPNEVQDKPSFNPNKKS